MIVVVSFSYRYFWNGVILASTSKYKGRYRPVKVGRAQQNKLSVMSGISLYIYPITIVFVLIKAKHVL